MLRVGTYDKIDLSFYKHPQEMFTTHLPSERASKKQDNEAMTDHPVFQTIIKLLRII